MSHLDLQHTKRWVVEPRLATRWQAAPGLALKGAAGVYRKLTDPFSGVLIEGFGQPDLAAERAVHAVVGVEEELGAVSFGLEGFSVWRDQLPSPTDAVRFRDGRAEPLLFDSSGRGRGGSGRSR